jgi:hypothetical protein
VLLKAATPVASTKKYKKGPEGNLIPVDKKVCIFYLLSQNSLV